LGVLRLKKYNLEKNPKLGFKGFSTFFVLIFSFPPENCIGLIVFQVTLTKSAILSRYV